MKHWEKLKNPVQKGLESGCSKHIFNIRSCLQLSWLYDGLSLGEGEYLALVAHQEKN